MKKNYESKLKEIIKDYKERNILIDDIIILYNDFIHFKKVNKHNYLWHKVRQEIDKQYQKRVKKDNFNKYLFSKIIYNWLYDIRQYKNDAIPCGCNKESDTYKFYASHQYIRRELEVLNIEQIMYLSYKLACTFRQH